MKTANLKGASISYRDAGVGAPLLLVHAFPLSGDMWDPQAAILARTRRVIVPDLRGFGASSSSAHAASLDQYADDLADLLDHIGIADEKVSIAGLSMGGYIVFAFLRRYRQRIQAVILADTRAKPDSDEAKQGREKMARLVEENGSAAIVEHMLPKLLSSHAPENLRAKVRRMIEENDRAGVAAALRAMAGRPDATPELGSLALPCLILVGQEDQVTPPADARSMHEAIRGSRLIEIPCAGHLANLEGPEAFTTAMAAFLDEYC